MSPLARLKKIHLIFRKSTVFGHIRLPGSTFEVDFLNAVAKFQNSLEGLLGEVVRNNVWNFGISIVKRVRGGGGASRFASRHFPKSVILASCIFVGRPFTSCYACSFVIFHFF